MHLLSAPRQLGSLLKSSRAFFLDHGLPGLAEALPEKAVLADEAREALEGGIAEGFTRCFVFPAPDLLAAALPEMIVQLVAADAPGLPLAQQYGRPWVQDVRALQTAKTRNRPPGPYALMMSPGFFPDETRNLRASQIDRLFAARGWTSLTVAEYCVLQRESAEQFCDHRFDDYHGAPAHPAQLQWLLDTRPGETTAMAYWFAAKRQVALAACREGSNNARKGAHPTRIVPLG